MGGFSAPDRVQLTILAVSFIPFVVVDLLGLYSGDPLVVATATGLAIASAGLALAWGTESLQFVVSQVLALAVLAIVQVVPEYSVEVVLAYRGASDPSLLAFATAAMTGANRLLLGLGWPTIYILSFAVGRSSGKSGGDLALEKQQGVEVLFLGVATIYSFVIALKGNLAPIDAAVLLAIFVAYLFVAHRLPPREEEKTAELEEPALAVAGLGAGGRSLRSSFFSL